jgi:hypothetical protein
VGEQWFYQGRQIARLFGSAGVAVGNVFGDVALLTLGGVRPMTQTGLLY